MNETDTIASIAAEDQRAARFNRRTFGILVAVVLASQGLYLFNQGVFWDAAAYLHGLETGRYAELKEHFWRNGAPPNYYLHRFVGLFPAPILASRVLYLASQIFTAYFLYRILSRLPGLPRLVAATAAVFSVLLPFSVVSFDLGLLAACLMTMFLVIGLEWLLAEAQADHRRAGWLRRASLRVLLALSFFHGTWLFLGMVGAAASVAPLLGPTRWRRAALARLRTWPGVHVLPFAFAAVKRVFFNPYGRYENYNKVAVPTAEQIGTWLGIPGKYWDRLYEVLSPWSTGLGEWERIVLAGALAATGIVIFYWMGRPLHARFVEVTRWRWSSRLLTAGAALALVYLTILPHFLVGRRALFFDGYISRDHMAVSVPIAALLAIVLFAILPRSPRISLLVVVAIAMRLVFFQADLAWKWLREDLKLRMIASLLQPLPEVQAAEIVVYEESVTQFNHLEWLEFQLVLARAFGDEKRIAFNTWELSRCPSLRACVKQFTPGRGEPFHEMAGARDARGCGLAVKAHIAPLPVGSMTWREFRAGYSGGESLRALAKTRIKVVTTILETLPCNGS